jgi:hypothetical protein
MALRDISSYGGRARRIAAAFSLVALAVAVFWLIQLLRGQVPEAKTSYIEFFIVYVSIVAMLFGRVASRPQVARWTTIVLMGLSWSLPLNARTFAFNSAWHVWHLFGPAGVATFAAAFVLWAGGLTVFGLQHQIPRAVAEADGPPPGPPPI